MFHVTNIAGHWRLLWLPSRPEPASSTLAHWTTGQAGHRKILTKSSAACHGAKSGSRCNILISYDVVWYRESCQNENCGTVVHLPYFPDKQNLVWPSGPMSIHIAHNTCYQIMMTYDKVPRHLDAWQNDKLIKVRFVFFICTTHIYTRLHVALPWGCKIWYACLRISPQQMDCAIFFSKPQRQVTMPFPSSKVQW